MDHLRSLQVLDRHVKGSAWAATLAGAAVRVLLGVVHMLPNSVEHLAEYQTANLADHFQKDGIRTITEIWFSWNKSTCEFVSEKNSRMGNGFAAQ